MKEKRKAYEEKLNGQLDAWNAHISSLKAQADKAQAEAKIEFYKTIEALQHKQDEARAKLHELKTAGDEEWEEYKTNTEKALEAFQTAFHGGAENFK